LVDNRRVPLANIIGYHKNMTKTSFKNLCFRNISIVIIGLLIISCTTRGEFINQAYLKVDRYDGISRQEALAIAEYYFNYKQSAFKKSADVYINRTPEELQNSWKFRIISKIPNVNIDIAYLVDKKDGQITETNSKAN